MTPDQVIETVVEKLATHHACHTIILYGSRARGDFTDASDYDIAGIRESGLQFREARFSNGVYLDLFVYPEKDLETLHSGWLDLRQGRILLEKGDFATRFFARLEAFENEGPKLLRVDEIEAYRTWYQKALDRIKMGGIQGDLRRMELVPTLLEHYFTTRGHWYRGPKASFKWLTTHKPHLYSAFEAAFHPQATTTTLAALVSLVDEEIAREAKSVSTGSDELLNRHERD